MRTLLVVILEPTWMSWEQFGTYSSHLGGMVVPTCLNLVELEGSCAYFGASWSQLGANLGQLVSNLG